MRKLFQGIILSIMVISITSCNKDDDPGTTEPQKSNIQQYVTVTRSATESSRAASTSCTMSFSKQGTWKIYAGTNPDAIDMNTPVGETTAASVEISGLDPHQHYYFEVILVDSF